MKIHSTNYFDTFIEVAEDTKANSGTPPPHKAKMTVAEMQYALIAKNPYVFTSDDILFQVFAERNEILKEDYPAERNNFFAKGQACLRTSPLTKTYGYGIHCNAEAKVALYALESDAYKSFVKDQSVKKIKAMKSSKF